MITHFAFSAVCVVLSSLPAPDDPPAAVSQERKSGAEQERKGGKDPEVRSISDQDLLRSLEKGAAAGEVASEHPLARVGQQMRDVQGRLVKEDPGEETQSIQQGIVRDLDKLIEELKKANKQQSQSQQQQKQQQKRQTSDQQAQQQGKPNQSSDPKEGQVSAHPGEVRDGQLSGNARIVRAVWGHLPEKLKEEMQQAFQDSGLPKYRPLIEQYFRAIAEQGESRR